MGQKGSKEAVGGAADGTLVEALVVDPASVGVNDDSDADTSASGGARGKAQSRPAKLQSQDSKSEKHLKNGNPTSPKRQNLFDGDLENGTNVKEKSGKREKKSKSKKSSFKRRTPSRRRSARVAPSIPPKSGDDSESEDAASRDPEPYFEFKKDVCVEIDDETNEPSMESETESLNLKLASDSESDVTATHTQTTGEERGKNSRQNPSTRGAATVTVGAVPQATPGAGGAGVAPEEGQDDLYFTPMQLYNAMNDGQLSPYLFDPNYILIIDTRDKAFYHDCHIVTAFHVSDLEKAAGKIGKLEDYTIILLYDTNGFTYSLTDSAISGLVDTFTERKLEPVILRGGYDAFFEHYPFLCCDKVISTNLQRQKLLLQYPSEILQGQLYLGRGDQATNEVIVRNLGLTHIVNITTEHQSAFPDTIEYLTIKREDEPSSDLHGVVLDVIQFTGDALLAGGRVLIHCNLGRSRSSTAVIAYLMATRRWTLKDAFFFVKERRPIIDPNRGFLKQLAKFEKEILGESISDPDELWMG